MADMTKIVSGVIAITISIIVVGSVLVPQITEYTSTGGALVEYKALLGAVVIMAIVAVLMIAVRLISTRE